MISTRNIPGTAELQAYPWKGKGSPQVRTEPAVLPAASNEKANTVVRPIYCLYIHKAVVTRDQIETTATRQNLQTKQ